MWSLTHIYKTCHTSGTVSRKHRGTVFAFKSNFHCASGWCVHRLYPVAPQNSRILCENVVLSGYNVPAGVSKTTLFSQIYFILVSCGHQFYLNYILSVFFQEKSPTLIKPK